MLAFENQNIEFKQEYVTDIRKEVMGFANAEGGTVYVGVRKDGAVLGINDPDANYAQTECQFRYCGTAIPFLTVRSTAR